MPELPPLAVLPGHEVTNQPPARGDADLWADDPWLRAHLVANGGDAAAVAAHGARLGTVAMREAGRDANRHPPEVRLFDRGGRRLDEVAFHPAYHQLMTAGLEAGYAARAWEAAPGGHVTHAALVYLHPRSSPAPAVR